MSHPAPTRMLDRNRSRLTLAVMERMRPVKLRNDYDTDIKAGVPDSMLDRFAKPFLLSVLSFLMMILVASPCPPLAMVSATELMIHRVLRGWVLCFAGFRLRFTRVPSFLHPSILGLSRIPRKAMIQYHDPLLI